MNCELQDKIFTVAPGNFDQLALDIFRFQYQHNSLYRQYADALQRGPGEVKEVSRIPFMPVGFFKQHAVRTGDFVAEWVFESSGTTQTGNSRHYVKSAALYRQSFMSAFRLFYGAPQEWCVAALLPSYLERGNSSLVVMADELIRESGDPRSGFYLDEYEKLIALLLANESEGRKTLLLGVTFALVDLAGMFPHPLRHTVVMETGGMKGRRREMVRQEVQELLRTAWQLETVHSEYGMTELLSQAYSFGNGLFRCPPWMGILLREEDDPLSVRTGISPKDISGHRAEGLSDGGSAAPGSDSRPAAVTGMVNVIDLANIYSCSFIATDDLGRLYADGSFEIIGRADASDIRGCSLMYV